MAVVHQWHYRDTVLVDKADQQVADQLWMG